MKNSFKIAFLALAIATSFAACKGAGESTADSAKADSAATADSVITADSAAADSAKADTTKKM